MKSKKIVALALTAALTVSAASMTAFAGVTYEDGSKAGSFAESTATIKFGEDEKDLYDELAGEDGKLTFKEANLKDLHDMDTGTKTFTGWSTAGGAEAEVEADDTELYDSFDTAKTDGTGKVYKACWTETTDDEQIAKNLKAIEDRKAKEAALKSREDHLNEEDKNHNATDNVNTGKGVETKPANVKRNDAPVSAEGDTSAYHDLQVAGVNLDANELAWLYEVTAPEKFMSSTKNARVQLELPDGYTTTNYKVTVYHVKGWCSKQKVTGLDIGEHDVAFWANDFSPYVLILTPKGATSGSSTDNPGTGDFSAVPVALLAAAALGATGFVAYKKRKAE